MGRCQTETSYLKSVVLWLREYSTGPAPRFYPPKQVERESRHHSARRTFAGLDREDAIIDLPVSCHLETRQNTANERPSTREDKITGEPRVASGMHGITRSGACKTYPTRRLFAFPKKAFHQSCLKGESTAEYVRWVTTSQEAVACGP
jgi:hypothetical protein